MEARLDEVLLSGHAAEDAEMLVIRDELLGGDGEMPPRSVAAIFDELAHNERSPYYFLYGCLATRAWKKAIEHIQGMRNITDL